MNRLRSRLARRHADSEEGQILIAMLTIIVMTSIALVGLGAIMLGRMSSQFDTRFERALAAAETGLDRMLPQVKAEPFAASFAPMSGSDGTTSWTVSATGGAGLWTLTASGTASDGTGSVTRTITEQVQVSNLLGHPLFADEALTIGGSASDTVIDRYDSAVSSKVCGSGGLLGTGLLESGSRMCTPASPALGRAGTNGALTIPGGSLTNLDGVDIYDAGVPGYPAPEDDGTCVGDASACAQVGSAITTHVDELEFPLSDRCENGIGAGAAAYDGSVALAANAIYSFTDVTLNATAIANLSNLSGTTIVICFSGHLIVPPAVPLNFEVDTLLPLTLKPRPPSTLVFISTDPGDGSRPRVDFGLGGLPTDLSAVVYAPNADCVAHGHLDLYGVAVCGSMEAPDGIGVHYDTQLGTLPFDQPITVSGWQEIPTP